MLLLAKSVVLFSCLYAVRAGFICPGGWEQGGESCFKVIIRDSAFTYDEYVRQCDQLGAIPAAIESELEREAINRASNSSVTSSILSDDTFIILLGALNLNEGKFPPKFHWESSKKSLANDDEMWYPGQPNPLSKMNPGVLDENCLMYSWERDGSDQTVLFRDYPCDCKTHPRNCTWQTKGIVCQRKTEQEEDIL